jgi:hypothetical protein
MSELIRDVVGKIDLNDAEAQTLAVRQFPWLPQVLLNDYLARGNCVACDVEMFVEVETGDEVEAKRFAEFIGGEINDEDLCLEHQPLMWLALGMAMTAVVVFADYPSDPVDFEARLLGENEYVMCALSAEGLALVWYQFGLSATQKEASL